MWRRGMRGGADIRFCWTGRIGGRMLDLPADAMPRDLIQSARERLRLVDVEHEGVLLDIDTPESYERGARFGNIRG